MTRKLPVWAYELMLVAAAAIWGFGTVVVKDAVNVIPPFWLVGIRFLSAGVLLSVVLLPRMLRAFNAFHLKAGGALGVFLALTYLLNTTGLAHTTASNSSFLTATYCVFAPFLTWALIRKKPTGYNVVAGVLCFAGIGLVALPFGGPFTIGLGDGLTLASSLACGLHIVLIAKFAPGRDMMALTAIQFVVAGIIACCWAAVNGAPPALSNFGGDMLGSMIYLVVCATCLTLLLQNVGLAHVDPAPGSLLLATEAVFGVIFSIALLGEVLTAQITTGFVLIFASVLVSEWLPISPFAKKRATLAGDSTAADSITAEDKAPVGCALEK